MRASLISPPHNSANVALASGASIPSITTSTDTLFVLPFTASHASWRSNQPKIRLAHERQHGHEQSALVFESVEHQVEICSKSSIRH